MSASLRTLTGSNVRVVMADGSIVTGKLATIDDRFNVALKGARDHALVDTPLGQGSADSVRIIRGETITGVFTE